MSDKWERIQGRMTSTPSQWEIVKNKKKRNKSDKPKLLKFNSSDEEEPTIIKRDTYNSSRLGDEEVKEPNIDPDDPFVHLSFDTMDQASIAAAIHVAFTKYHKDQASITERSNTNPEKPLPPVNSIPEMTKSTIPKTNTSCLEAADLWPNPLRNFRASDKEASEKFITQAMTTFYDAIQDQLRSRNLNGEKTIKNLADKVTHLEESLKDITSAYRQSATDNQNLKEEINLLNLKVAELEDRNRSTNLKLRGVPETIGPAELHKYTTEMIQTLLPDASKQELLVDHIHRLPRPSHLSNETPRDVLVKVHHYHVKDSFMQKTKKIKALPQPYQDIKIFNDLSATTLRKRKELKPVTDHLKKHKILFSWGSQARILIRRNNMTYVLLHLGSANNFFEELKIPLIDKRLLLPGFVPRIRPPQDRYREF